MGINNRVLLNIHYGNSDRVVICGKVVAEWRIGLSHQDSLNNFELCQSWKVKIELKGNYTKVEENIN